MPDINVPSLSNPTRTKAFSYLRFSTPEQERGDSFRRQTTLAEQYAARHGLDLDDSSFQDLGVSAFRGANVETGRLGDFLDLVRTGVVSKGSYLLVESLDRLSRNKPRKAVRLLERICEEGITLVTLSDGKVYDETILDEDPMAFMWAFMVAMRANEESAMKSRRGKAAWENKRANAAEKPLTRRAPAWLKLTDATGKFEIIEQRTAVVRRIFDMAARGIGPHSIAQTLNRENVPRFGRSKVWHRSYVVKTLANPAAIGTMIPHEMTYESGKKRRKPVGSVEGYFPAVVDAETFHRVNGLARNPARGKHAANGVVNVLGGIAKCSDCGGSVILVSKGNRSRYLVCSNAKTGGGCKYRAVRYDAVERSLIALAAAIVCPHSNGANPFLEPSPLEARCNSLHGAIEHLSDELYQNGPSPTISRRLREAEEELEQTEAALAAELKATWQSRHRSPTSLSPAAPTQSSL
jgi:DNA invertase Pin-like site-specific DNA recombinase